MPSNFSLVSVKGNKIARQSFHVYRVLKGLKRRPVVLGSLEGEVKSDNESCK
jgi:hypothetical protein